MTVGDLVQLRDGALRERASAPIRCSSGTSPASFTAAAGTPSGTAEPATARPKGRHSHRIARCWMGLRPYASVAPRARATTRNHVAGPYRWGTNLSGDARAPHQLITNGLTSFYGRYDLLQMAQQLVIQQFDIGTICIRFGPFFCLVPIANQRVILFSHVKQTQLEA